MRWVKAVISRWSLVVGNLVANNQRPATNHRMEAPVVQMPEVKSGRLMLC